MSVHVQHRGRRFLPLCCKRCRIDIFYDNAVFLISGKSCDKTINNQSKKIKKKYDDTPAEEGFHFLFPVSEVTFVFRGAKQSQLLV